MHSGLVQRRSTVQTCPDGHELDEHSHRPVVGLQPSPRKQLTPAQGSRVTHLEVAGSHVWPVGHDPDEHLHLPESVSHVSPVGQAPQGPASPPPVGKLVGHPASAAAPTAAASPLRNADIRCP